MVTGFLLLCDSRRILLSKLLITPDTSLPQPPFYYVGLGLLVAGLAVCATTALGCWITYMPGYIILTMVFIFVYIPIVYLFSVSFTSLFTEIFISFIPETGLGMGLK